MRALAIFLILFLSYFSSYSQDMSVQQTVDYINNKFASNPISDEIDFRRTFNSTTVYTLSVESSGKLKLARKIKIDLRNKHIGDVIIDLSFFPNDMKFGADFIYCSNNEVCIAEKTRLIEIEQDFQASVEAGNESDIKKNNSIRTIIFHNINDADLESILNAFKYLFKKIQDDKSYSLAENTNDPFAPKRHITRNELSEGNSKLNEVSTGINSNTITMVKMQSGTYEVPVVLNGVLKISFIFDSGASDISISPDVALTLMRTGTIKESDFIGTQKYRFADGSTATSRVFILHSIKIGNKEVKEVTASISSTLSAPMLLGQSVLQRFGKFTIDNANHTITIE